jgi:uncharacterized protein
MAFSRLSAAMIAVMTAACAGSSGNAPPPLKEAETVRPSEAPKVDEYQAGIQRFQHDREASLKTDTGWLTIAGLFFLTQPKVTFGSDPLNDIVLPASAPARAGTIQMSRGEVRVEAEPGVNFLLAGKPFTSGVLKSDGSGPPDRISLGDLQLWVHMSGGRPSIRLRDRNSRLRTEFAGTSWFPIDPSYRVDATYEPYPRPKTIQVPNILGDIDNMTVPGLVAFTLNGQSLKMEAVTEGDVKQFWFIFRDLTSGKETYPAARFLYMPAPVNGRMTLDFNRSENPPCAYNPYTTCPLPPEQNRLRIRVEAGEKAYAAHQ